MIARRRKFCVYSKNYWHDSCDQAAVPDFVDLWLPSKDDGLQEEHQGCAVQQAEEVVGPHGAAPSGVPSVVTEDALRFMERFVHGPR